LFKDPGMKGKRKGKERVSGFRLRKEIAFPLQEKKLAARKMRWQAGRGGNIVARPERGKNKKRRSRSQGKRVGGKLRKTKKVSEWLKKIRPIERNRTAKEGPPGSSFHREKKREQTRGKGKASRSRKPQKSRRRVGTFLLKVFPNKEEGRGTGQLSRMKNVVDFLSGAPPLRAEFGKKGGGKKRGEQFYFEQRGGAALPLLGGPKRPGFELRPPWGNTWGENRATKKEKKEMGASCFAVAHEERCPNDPRFCQGFPIQKKTKNAQGKGFLRRGAATEKAPPQEDGVKPRMGGEPQLNSGRKGGKKKRNRCLGNRDALEEEKRKQQTSG